MTTELIQDFQRARELIDCGRFEFICSALKEVGAGSKCFVYVGKELKGHATYEGYLRSVNGSTYEMKKKRLALIDKIIEDIKNDQ